MKLFRHKGKQLTKIINKIKHLFPDVIDEDIMLKSYLQKYEDLRIPVNIMADEMDVPKPILVYWRMKFGFNRRVKMADHIKLA